MKGALDDLSKEDLRERLFVAEKVMKSLFERNKELEQMAQPVERTETFECCNCKSIK
ncbi:MAG: hypothetical protein ACK521_08270 [bacterium]